MATVKHIEFYKGEMIHYQERAFRVIRVCKKKLIVREVFVCRRRKTISERVGDKFEMDIIQN